jgi:hypothetical protein
MNRIALLFIAVLFAVQACTTIEEVPCKSGHGYLYKNGKEFVCPFEILRRTNSGGERRFVVVENKPTILAADVSEYFPLARRGSPLEYTLSMTVPKEYFTEEQYTVSLWTEDKSFKPCGEAKETIFYKIMENENSIEYKTLVLGELLNSGDYNNYGTTIFFGEKEMPSYFESRIGYHVLKVCDDGFSLKGEIVNE